METATADIDTDALSTSLAADLTGSMDLTPADEPVDDALAPTPVDDDAPVNRDEQGRFKASDKYPEKSPAADSPPLGDAPAAPVDDLPVPKSWAKETHALWQKAARGEPLTKEESRALLTTFNTRESQMAEGAKSYATDAEYGKSVRSAAASYEPLLKSQGLDVPKAVGYLLKAHAELSSGTADQKLAYLNRIAETYGVKLPSTPPADPNAPPPAELPPEVKAALEKVDRIEGDLNAERNRRFEEHHAATAAEVNAFAADPKHPYFEECADHICMLLKGDPSMKLEAAYDTAVWANPVTRQKELNRLQTERDEANRKAVAEAALKAKKSTSTNVKGRDTQRAPQAPAATLNNLDDVMRETHEEIRSRAN